jgi:hypothetical protein
MQEAAMATRTITRLFDSYDNAAQAVQSLEAQGVPHDDISLVSNDAEGRYGNPSANAGNTSDTAGDATGAGMTTAGRTSGDPAQGASTGAGSGATLGTVLGGGAGLLAGLGMLAIPGVGPIVAAGWLVAALTGAGVGAAAGGLVGSLTGAGVSEADAHVHAEGVRRGGAMVTVRADDAKAASIEALLDGRSPVDLSTRRAEYEAEGWKGYDPAAPAYTVEQVTRERNRRVSVT